MGNVSALHSQRMPGPRLSSSSLSFGMSTRLLLSLTTVYGHILFCSSSFLTTQSITIVEEYKVEQCLCQHDRPKLDRFEASGVIAMGGATKTGLLVVLDNSRAFVQLDADLLQCKNSTGRLINVPSYGEFNSHNTIDEQLAGEEGFEAITVDNSNGVIFSVEETSYNDMDVYRARVQSFSPNFETKLSDQLLDYEFGSKNKGVEGVAALSYGENTFLLALCEGNKCSSGSTGEMPGGGTILVYYGISEQIDGELSFSWKYNDKIKLPEDLNFIDYSGLDVRRRDPNNLWEIAVVSQESSELFWGIVTPVSDPQKPAGVDWKVSDSLGVFSFPAGYCNVEGITFLDGYQPNITTLSEDGEKGIDERRLSISTHFAAVSDKAKKSQPDSCANKDQSVHIIHVQYEGAEIFAAQDPLEI